MRLDRNYDDGIFLLLGKEMCKSTLALWAGLDIMGLGGLVTVAIKAKEQKACHWSYNAREKQRNTRNTQI